jgi:hypothetical protein
VDEEGLDRQAARQLAVSLHAVLQSAGRVLATDRESPLQRMITDHVGVPISQLPNVMAVWPDWEHANLQRGVDAYLDQHSPQAAWFGVGGPGRSFQGLVDMLTTADHGAYELGAVEYTSVPVGPDRSIDAVQFGLVRTVAPAGAPVVISVRGGGQHGEPVCSLQVLAADQASGTAVREHVERLMRDLDVFRGQVLTFGFSEHRGNRLVTFQPRPTMQPDEVILPPGVLETVQQHVVLAGARAQRLRAAGQHVKRGLLLHGPPGTGKTHTVRYLMSRLTGSTVVVVSGMALPMIAEATALARRLQPAVVVVEDVDMIAQDRSFSGPFGNPLLFQLLNEIDGVGADSDVTFVLTTNRVDVLEAALVDRPGRIDLAVHIPRPDAAARLRLLRLYARGVRLELPDSTALLQATEGVSASFMREVVRRAVLRALGAADEPPRLDEQLLGTVLDELLDERHALTRAILGGQPAGTPGPSGPPSPFPAPYPSPWPAGPHRHFGTYVMPAE